MRVALQWRCYLFFYNKTFESVHIRILSVPNSKTWYQTVMIAKLGSCFTGLEWMYNSMRMCVYLYCKCAQYITYIFHEISSSDVWVDFIWHSSINVYLFPEHELRLLEILLWHVPRYICAFSVVILADIMYPSISELSMLDKMNPPTHRRIVNIKALNDGNQTPNAYVCKTFKKKKLALSSRCLEIDFILSMLYNWNQCIYWSESTIQLK